MRIIRFEYDFRNARMDEGPSPVNEDATDKNQSPGCGRKSGGGEGVFGCLSQGI